MPGVLGTMKSNRYYLHLCFYFFFCQLKQFLKNNIAKTRLEKVPQRFSDNKTISYLLRIGHRLAFPLMMYFSEIPQLRHTMHGMDGGNPLFSE